MTVTRGSEMSRGISLSRMMVVLVLMVITLACLIPVVSADREIIQDIKTFGAPA